MKLEYNRFFYGWYFKFIIELSNSLKLINYNYDYYTNITYTYK